jgi:hypothetical protein
MKKGWTTTKLIAIGGLAVLRFLVKIIIYTPALMTTGSIFTTILPLLYAPFFNVLVALVINKFGAVTIFSVVCAVIELPLPVVYPKAINLVARIIIGLSIDCLFYFFRNRKKLFVFLGGFFTNFIELLVGISLIFSIGLLGIQNLPKGLLTPMGIISGTLFISVLGGFLGYIALASYERLKNTTVIKRIQQ